MTAIIRTSSLKSWLLATAVLLSVSVISSQAQAACGTGGPNFVATGSVAGPCDLDTNAETLTVTSTGILSNGSGDAVSATATGLSISTSSGGQISGSDNGAMITSGGAITSYTNNGTSTGAAGAGIHVNDGSIGTLTNGGTVSGTGNASGLTIDDPSIVTTVTNNGTFTAANGEGILVGGVLTTLNNNSTISSTGAVAIDLDGSTMSDGIGTITNASTGSISGLTAGIENDFGVIGTITNDGTISATTTGSGFGIYNSSTITTITNENGGTITGGAYGIYTTGAITTLNNKAGSTITSDEYTIRVGSGGSIGTLNNAGIINDLSSSFDAVEVDSGATLGALNNTGTISGSIVGIYNAGTITDIENTSGVIASTTTWSSGAEGAIENVGTITTLNNGGTITSVSDALYNTGTVGSITNSGSLNITGTAAYTALYNTATGSIGTITNTGTISTVSGDYGIVNYGAITEIDNKSGGAIATTGSSETLVNYGTLGTLLNEAGATISSDTYTVVNGGTITNLTNNGTISSPYYTLQNYNGGIITALNNTGTISSTGGATISNDSGGTITTFNNTGTVTGTDGDAIENAGTMTLNNTGGTISTDTGFGVYNYNTGTLTLNNTGGTISATTGIALRLDAPTTGNLVNTNGLITNNSSTVGAVVIEGAFNGQTIVGGTISNTNTSNAATAISILNASSGAINFQGVTIIADGDTTGSGHGIALDTVQGATAVNLDAATVVRGSLEETGTGTLAVTTSATITGGILGGAGNDTLTVNGGSISGAINLAGGTNTLAINSDFTNTGAISTTGAINATVASGQTFTADATVGLGTGQLTNHGTVVIGNGVTVSAATLNAAAGTFTYNVGSNAGALTAGSLNLSAGAANMLNDTISVGTVTGSLNTTTSALIATGTGTAVLPSTTTVADNSYLYNFALSQGTTGSTNNIYLVETQAQSLANSADNQNNLNVSQVILGTTTTNAAFQQLQTNLNNAPNRAAYNAVLASALPTADDGAPMAAMGFSGQALDVTDDQLADIQTGGKGASSGNQPYGLHAWMQGLGQHADEDARDGVSGYNADTFGAAFGLDTRNISPNDVVGLSFAYGKSYVYSQDVNSAYTSVNTYQLTAYGNHAFSDDYFVAGMAAFGWDENSETRHNVAGTADDASADYDSWQGGGRVETGRNFRLNGQFAGATLTPMASVDYLHYNASAYTESGAGAADLHVNSLSEDILNLGVSGRAQWLIDLDKTTRILPDVHAGYWYDVLNNDAADVTSSFTAGGSTFSTRGLNPSNSTFDIGTGVKLYGTGAWDFSLAYDFTVKPDYTAHSGVVRAAYSF